jgi:hypothetical protein
MRNVVAAGLWIALGACAATGVQRNTTPEPAECKRDEEATKKGILARCEVIRSIESVIEDVRACGRSPGGVATVAFTFESDGRVHEVRVVPRGEGERSQTTIDNPEVIACVEARVSQATVPPFKQPKFEVRFPFKVGPARECTRLRRNRGKC